MNWLFWGVLAVIVFFALRGYKRGFIKVAYSLVAIILSIVLVSVLTPHIKETLLTRTDMYDRLTKRCTQAVEKKYLSNSDESHIPKSEEDVLKGAKVNLPFAVKATVGVLTKGQATPEDFFEKAGRTVAMWLLCAISFVVTLILVGIVISVIEGALDLVAKLPLIHGTNQILGMGAGMLQGLLIVWVACIILTSLCATEMFDSVYELIEANKYLSFLYENNGIVYLASYFLM